MPLYAPLFVYATDFVTLMAICPYMLLYATLVVAIPAYTTICPYMLIYAPICSYMLIYVPICSYMLIYALHILHT